MYVSPSQFCCESKTALKNTLKKETEEHEKNPGNTQ